MTTVTVQATVKYPDESLDQEKGRLKEARVYFHYALTRIPGSRGQTQARMEMGSNVERLDDAFE